MIGVIKKQVTERGFFLFDGPGGAMGIGFFFGVGTYFSRVSENKKILVFFWCFLVFFGVFVFLGGVFVLFGVFILFFAR